MRIIDYDAAIDRYYAEHEAQCSQGGMDDRDWLKKCFEDAPAVDVEPVIHAHCAINWLGDCYCSNCGESIDCTSNYCNRCGAKLDELEQWIG